MKESQASQDSSVTFSARRGPRSSAAAVGQNLGPVPSPALPKRLAVHLGCLGLVGLLLTACGGGRATSTGSTLGPRPTSSSTSTSTSTTDPAGLAVLTAYRAASGAFEQALATANPADPALATTMVDPQLQSVKANLLADQRQGIVGRGSVTLHPKVFTLSGSTATVIDCAYSTTELVYKATGKPVPPVTPPENDGIRATLDLAGGSWKVAKQTVTEGSCVPGS
jgi:hypothetical protein